MQEILSGIQEYRILQPSNHLLLKTQKLRLKSSKYLILSSTIENNLCLLRQATKAKRPKANWVHRGIVCVLSTLYLQISWLDSKYPTKTIALKRSLYSALKDQLRILPFLFLLVIPHYFQKSHFFKNMNNEEWSIKRTWLPKKHLWAKRVVDISNNRWDTSWICTCNLSSKVSHWDMDGCKYMWRCSKLA